jgi:hypothetical protein
LFSQACLRRCDFLWRGVSIAPQRDMPPVLGKDDPAPLPARLNFFHGHPALRALGNCMNQGATKTLKIFRSKGMTDVGYGQGPTALIRPVCFGQAGKKRKNRFKFSPNFVVSDQLSAPSSIPPGIYFTNPCCAAAQQNPFISTH